MFKEKIFVGLRFTDIDDIKKSNTDIVLIL